MHNILELYNKINKFGQDHDMKFEVPEPGKVIYRMKVQERHMATPVAIHGGMVAGMMDSVLGVAALSVSCERGRLVSTVEFKLNFLHPAHLGDELVGEGTVEEEGNRIIITSGVISAVNRDTVIAKGMGTFNSYPYEKSGIEEKLKKG
ncbi:PaaI family thioesterase [Salibacter halophilus]|uniref:PaaI family thioesterase n=1 Tax=Salibacter halophilus TaxID=1803916 RepID=A0A6N6M571_9FLAO|nr:PaaI family thioesterase [Salibacter halophilus]KAB1064759.1 PaaI family thioesterase [Salibacter halophilus]